MRQPVDDDLDVDALDWVNLDALAVNDEDAAARPGSQKDARPWDLRRPVGRNTVDDFEVLHEVQDRVLWLSTALIHHANRVRPNPSRVKVGGHPGRPRRRWSQS